MKNYPVFLIDEETLREVVQNSEEFNQYIENLRRKMKSVHEPSKKATLLGDIGACLRIAGRLDDAETCLLQALALIETHELGLKLEMQQKIRLAHIYQWQKNFSGSEDLFDEVVETCRQQKEADFYLPFALQHAGKNFFDQHKYRKALSCFEEALKLRTERASPDDQVESAQKALRATHKKLKS